MAIEREKQAAFRMVCIFFLNCASRCLLTVILFVIVVCVALQLTEQARESEFTRRKLERARQEVFHHMTRMKHEKESLEREVGNNGVVINNHCIALGLFRFFNLISFLGLSLHLYQCSNKAYLVCVMDQSFKIMN